MNQKTRDDMNELAKLGRIVYDARQRQADIKNDCKHLDYVVSYIKTFKFDYEPWRVCLVCKSKLERPTEDEMWKAFEEHFGEEAWSELSQKYKERIVKGYNLG